MNNINTTLNSLLNTDLGIKQQGNLKPNIKDSKDYKDPLKDTSSLVQEAISEDDTLELGIKKLVNKLLDSIKASKDLSNLADAKNINISKNIAKDLNELKTILNKDKDLKVFANKLDELLNTKLQDSKALFKALNNSGVFLESKLRINLNEQVLPDSFFRLISSFKNIKSKELKAEIFKLGNTDMNAEKSIEKLESFIDNKLQNKPIKNEIIKTLDLLKNARAFLQKNTEPIKLLQVANAIDKPLSKAIKSLINIEVKNSEIKSILPRLASLKANITNIKNIAREIINNPANIANNYKGVNLENNILNKLENIKNILVENHENDLISKNLNQEIKQIINDKNSQINKNETIKSENEIDKNQNNTKETNQQKSPTLQKEPTTSEEIKTNLKALQEISKTQDIKEDLKIIENPQIKSQINQNQTISQIINSENLSLQNKLENLARLLSANLKNDESFKAYKTFNELKGLNTHLKQAKKDLNQIQPRTLEYINKNLNNDTKAILLQASKVALDKDNKTAFDLSQKVLNQIELNQIISVANKEVNTFLPYSLDELEESNLSFKNDGEDKFYAQIKLKFKKLGNINVLLGLHKDKYLDINMMIENDEFRRILIDNAREFKKDLRKANLITSNFFISKLRDYKYEDSSDFNLGLDIKAWAK